MMSVMAAKLKVFIVAPKASHNAIDARPKPPISPVDRLRA
jgi:hypothetical protein